jgi:hypothetical protein
MCWYADYSGLPKATYVPKRFRPKGKLVSYLGTHRHKRHIKRHVFEEDNYEKWYVVLWNVNVMEPESLPTVQPAANALSVTTSPAKPVEPVYGRSGGRQSELPSGKNT